MEGQVKNLTGQEKENVLLVLNEFSEDYKANTKSLNGLIAAVKECTGRIDMQTERMANLQTSAEPGSTNQLHELVDSAIKKMGSAINSISYTVNQLQQLSAKLDKNISLLQNPAPQKIVHHHHVPKIAWIAAGLFVVLVLACSGWHMTAGNLDEYKNSDIKYRYLKQKSNLTLLQILNTLDSLQLSGYAMKDSVTLWENEEKKAFELSRKLQLKSEESGELKGELQELENQNRRRKEIR